MSKKFESYPILIEVDSDYWTCSHNNITWIYTFSDES